MALEGCLASILTERIGHQRMVWCVHMCVPCVVVVCLTLVLAMMDPLARNQQGATVLADCSWCMDVASASIQHSLPRLSSHDMCVLQLDPVLIGLDAAMKMAGSEEDEHTLKKQIKTREDSLLPMYLQVTISGADMISIERPLTGQRWDLSWPMQTEVKNLTRARWYD